jgi:hypothetical protein
MANTRLKRSQQTFRVIVRDRFHLSRKEFGYPQLQDGSLENEEREMGGVQNPVDGNTAQQVGNTTDPFEHPDLEVCVTGGDQSPELIGILILQP